MKITRKEQINGQWTLWVTEDGINCDILTYKDEPKEDRVFADYQKIVDQREAEVAKQAELEALLIEQQKLEEEING